MLMGSILEVNEVHAFSPAVYATVWASFRNRDWTQLRERWRDLLRIQFWAPASVRKSMDLKRVLSRWNGRTSYTIHVCRNHAIDMQRAQYLRECPHVSVSAYDCGGHSVARRLARQKKLKSIFAPAD